MGRETFVCLLPGSIHFSFPCVHLILSPFFFLTFDKTIPSSAFISFGLCVRVCMCMCVHVCSDVVVWKVSCTSPNVLSSVGSFCPEMRRRGRNGVSKSKVTRLLSALCSVPMCLAACPDPLSLSLSCLEKGKKHRNSVNLCMTDERLRWNLYVISCGVCFR